MTFGQAITQVFRKYAEFSGRASRPEFWWFFAFSLIVSSALGSIFQGLSAAWFFAVLLPSFAVSVRRLRDAGLAWQWLFFLLLPIVGFIVVLVLLAQPSRVEDQPVGDVPPGRVPPVNV